MKKTLFVFLFACLIAIVSVSSVRGECENGDCLNGKGEFIYDNGDKYSGEWKKGKKSGLGTFVFKKKKENTVVGVAPSAFLSYDTYIALGDKARMEGDHNRAEMYYLLAQKRLEESIKKGEK